MQQEILLNNPGVRLTKEQEAFVNTKYEQYLFFTVKGFAECGSYLNIKFKKAHHAINAFNTSLATGFIVGKHTSGSNDKIAERI